jgi:hypothetical protein
LSLWFCSSRWQAFSFIVGVRLRAGSKQKNTMHNVRFPSLAVLAFAAFLGLESQPAAGQSQLTIAQSVSPSGTTLLTISGLRDTYCYTTDQTNVAVAPHAVTIDTVNHGVICFPLIPWQFFSITVDVGHLDPGHYTVVWSFDPPLSASLPPTSFAFDASAPAISAIPTVGPVALLLSLIAIALLGMFSVRERA